MTDLELRRFQVAATTAANCYLAGDYRGGLFWSGEAVFTAMKGDFPSRIVRAALVAYEAGKTEFLSVPPEFRDFNPNVWEPYGRDRLRGG